MLRHRHCLTELAPAIANAGFLGAPRAIERQVSAADNDRHEAGRTNNPASVFRPASAVSYAEDPLAGLPDPRRALAVEHHRASEVEGHPHLGRAMVFDGESAARSE